MNFFNKYKDLFGVPDGTPIPPKLTLSNNGLFIDKPFVPTYQETISINSKLRDLRKDYNQLEQEIQSINLKVKSPNRAISRKGKQLSEFKEKDKDKSRNMQNSGLQASSPFLKLDHKKNIKNDSGIFNAGQASGLQENLQARDPFAKKRMSWLRDDQVNLVKHSEMNYIFNHKIKEQNPRTKNISEMPMPKVENILGSNYNVSSPNMPNMPSLKSPIRTVNRQDNSKKEEVQASGRRQKIPQTMQNSQNMHNQQKRRQSNKGELDREGALKRREDARRNIKTRREKLGFLYRTAW